MDLFDYDVIYGFENLYQAHKNGEARQTIYRRSHAIRVFIVTGAG